jgi:hypothetical protein
LLALVSPSATPVVGVAAGLLIVAVLAVLLVSYLLYLRGGRR